MRKKYQQTGIMLFVLAFSLFNVMLALNLKPSYAVDPETTGSGIPSGTFTSNVTSNTKANYIKDALNSVNRTSEYTNSFDVIKDFKTSDNKTPLYSLMKNKTFPTTAEKFERLDDNPINITNNGLLYIISHGYNPNNTESTIFSTLKHGAVTDNSIKEYITQIAVWLYIYENQSSLQKYCIDYACIFYDDGGATISAETIRTFIADAASINGYEFLAYITDLVDKAKTYNGDETSKIASLSATKFTYEIDSSFTTLVTDTVTPQVTGNKDNFMYYSVEIDDPNAYGAYIADINNKKITNTGVMNGSFKVVVPLKEDITKMNLSSIKVHVYGHFIKDSGSEYRVTSTTNGLVDENKKQKYTNVIYGYTPNEVIETNFTLYNFTKISKVDATNSKELPGATLVITNKNDENETYEWVSSDTPHYIFLEDGEYKLCETIAPEGYEKATECIDFTIDGKNIKAVEMKNKPVQKALIPNTGVMQKYSPYIIGAILILIGLGTTGYIIYQKERKS